MALDRRESDRGPIRARATSTSAQSGCPLRRTGAGYMDIFRPRAFVVESSDQPADDVDTRFAGAAARKRLDPRDPRPLAVDLRRPHTAAAVAHRAGRRNVSLPTAHDVLALAMVAGGDQRQQGSR